MSDVCFECGERIGTKKTNSLLPICPMCEDKATVRFLESEIRSVSVDTDIAKSAFISLASRRDRLIEEFEAALERCRAIA